MNAGWARAASLLARRVERRERAGALLQALGLALCAGGALGLCLRALGAGLPAALAPACGLLAGLVLGLRRARRVSAVDGGSAAWALDRVAGAHEAGLAAAERGPLAGTGAPPVPRVRLAPLAGVPACVAGVLLAGLCMALPAPRGDGSSAREAGEDRDLRVVGTLDAAGADAIAAKAAEDARLRAALGLSPERKAEAPALEQALRDPALRNQLRERAGTGSALATALDQPDAAAAASALAGVLDEGLQARRALEALRRQEAAAPQATPFVPPTRRALVARYLDARAGGEGR